MGKAPYKAVDVAEYLLTLNGGESMSAFKLQKILYYAQAWSLALRDRALFDEPIEAWVNGPVCRAVYDEHRRRYAISTVRGDAREITDSDDRDFLNDLFKAYSQFDADTLVTMTHIEDPWKQARQGVGPREHGHTVITHDSMRQYYASLAEDPTARVIN